MSEEVDLFNKLIPEGLVWNALSFLCAAFQGYRSMFYYGVSHKELDEYATALLDDPNTSTGELPAEKIIEFYKHDYEGLLELPEQSLWNDMGTLPEEEDEFLLGPWYHELQSHTQSSL